jgi:hypothetical protein
VLNHLFVGIAQFTCLTLNKAGGGYRFKYVARHTEFGTAEVAETTGDMFSVVTGLP